MKKQCLKKLIVHSSWLIVVFVISLIAMNQIAYTQATVIPFLSGGTNADSTSINGRSIDTSGLGNRKTLVYNGTSGHYELVDAVNVKDYGAKGDGSTDDTAAIQNALNNPNGYPVYFPKGTYVLKGNNPSAGAVEIPSNMVMFSDGDATLKTKAGCANSTVLLHAQGKSNIKILGLTLDGNKTNQANSCSLIYFDGSNIEIANNTLLNSKGYGIQSGPASDVNIYNNTFSNIDGSGVSLQSGAKSVSVTHNKLTTIGSIGIQVYSGDVVNNFDITINDNQLKDVLFEGIEIQRAQRCTVNSNILHASTTGGGLSIGSCDYMNAVGNVVDGYRAYGIELGGNYQNIVGNVFSGVAIGVTYDSAGSHNTIANNVITGIPNNATSDGMRLYGARDVTVSGNTIINPGGSGIRVNWSNITHIPASDITINGNNFYFNTTRVDSPLALTLANNPSRVHFVDNHYYTSVDYVPVPYNGVINVNGATDLEIRNNEFYAFTASPAQLAGIKVWASAPGLRIIGNKIKNFATGISTKAYTGSDVWIINNDIAGCTTPYGTNSHHKVFVAVPYTHR